MLRVFLPAQSAMFPFMYMPFTVGACDDDDDDGQAGLTNPNK
jgi:hypothetical protein